VVTLATTSVVGSSSHCSPIPSSTAACGAKVLVIENVLADDQPDACGHILDVVILTTTVR
jgi:hypothetical protein